MISAIIDVDHVRVVGPIHNRVKDGIIIITKCTEGAKEEEVIHFTGTEMTDSSAPSSFTPPSPRLFRTSTTSKTMKQPITDNSRKS